MVDFTKGRGFWARGVSEIAHGICNGRGIIITILMFREHGGDFVDFISLAATLDGTVHRLFRGGDSMKWNEGLSLVLGKYRASGTADSGFRAGIRCLV